MNAEMREADKHITGMEKWCGLCVCPWNRFVNNDSIYILLYSSCSLTFLVYYNFNQTNVVFYQDIAPKNKANYFLKSFRKKNHEKSMFSRQYSRVSGVK